jgi:hypothetical protein
MRMKNFPFLFHWRSKISFKTFQKEEKKPSKSRSWKFRKPKFGGQLIQSKTIRLEGV